MLAFVPWWPDAAAAPRWALLAVAVPLAWPWIRQNRWTVAEAAGAAFIAWAALSLAWAPNLWDGLDALWKLILLAGLIRLGRDLPSLTPVYVGAALGLWVNAALLWADLPSANGASALFFNRNHLAMAAALILVAAPRWCAIGVLPALLVPGARGPLLAVAAAWLIRLPWRWRIPAAVGIAIAAAVVLGWRPDSIGERLGIWRDTWAGLTLFGHGLGGFWTDFPQFATHIDLMQWRPSHAHNDILEILYELGLPGLLLVAPLVWLVAAAPHSAERAILIAFAVESCVDWPLHLPVTAALAALALGRLCRDGPALRDVLHCWAIAVRAWLARHDRPGWGFLAACRRHRVSARP